MATIPQAKPNPKHEAPQDATLDWLVREMYKDLKEIKEEWCPKVSQLQAIAAILGLVCGIYTIQNAQVVIDALAKWANLR